MLLLSQQHVKNQSWILVCLFHCLYITILFSLFSYLFIARDKLLLRGHTWTEFENANKHDDCDECLTALKLE